MIFDIPREELSHLIEVTRMLCLHHRQKLGVDSLNLVVSNGSATHQQIMHFHLHIVPRKAGDGIKFWPKQEQKSDRELELVQRKFATQFLPK